MQPVIEDFIRDEKTHKVSEVEKRKCGIIILPTFFEQLPSKRVSLNVRKSDLLTIFCNLVIVF